MVTALFSLSALASSARADTRVTLYTMGPGDDVFSTFGHAAACVTDARNPLGICFNYGVAVFHDPVEAVTDVLRGEALFWLETAPTDDLVGSFQERDRTVWRQDLPLYPAAAEALARAFRGDAAKEDRRYVYRHFGDNCATRLRDRIDRATGGMLRAGADVPHGVTFRELTRNASGADLRVLLFLELAMGRANDRPATTWEAMAIPEVLREVVEQRLGAKAEEVVSRGAETPAWTPGKAFGAFLGAGAALGLLAAPLRRQGLLRHVGLALAGGVLGSVALVLDLLAAVSTLPEMESNELVAVFLPTDLALPFLREHALRTYLLVRMGGLVLVLLLRATGLLAEPVWTPIAFVALVLAPLLLRGRTTPAAG